MKTAIFYYTGTGNSLWVARKLADTMGDAALFSMSKFREKEFPVISKSIGLIFPVYIWGVPAPVMKFIKKLHDIQPAYIFAVAVHGGQVANTLVQLKKTMDRNGLILSSGFEIRMPSNYIPWGGSEPLKKQYERFERASEKICRIAFYLKENRVMAVEKGPFWQRILFSIIYRLSFSHVLGLDRHFWTYNRCNACGICREVCPADNITIHEGKPLWNHRCDQCFACLQWCPEKAIQYGRKTLKYERYHHPEVILNDIIQSRQDENMWKT